MIPVSISKSGIYAVRGIAALLVLFLHISSLLIPQEVWVEKSGALKHLLPWLFRGEVGVGIFIFLSGFLLTLNIPASTQEWSRFYLRRFSRIYPVYGIVLLMAISVTRQWDFNGFMNAFFLFPNFPGTLWPAPYLSTAWSLGIEWTLYFIFPLLLVSIRTRLRNIILLIVFLEFIIYFGHSVGTDFHTLVYGSIIGRTIEFLLGMALALNFEKITRIEPKQLLIILILSYLIFHAWCMWYLKDGGSVSESYLRMLQPLAESLFGFVLIVVSQFHRHRLVELATTPIMFVGIISYPLYLTHLIVLDAMKRYTSKQNDPELILNIGAQSVLIVAFSILLAWVIHEAIEKPGMKWGRSMK